MQTPDEMVEALVASDDFHAWVAGTATDDEAARWEAWLAQSPQHAAAVREARTVVLGLSFEAPPMPDVEAEWQRLRNRLEAPPRTAPRRLRPLHTPRLAARARHERRSWGVAVGLAVLLVAVMSVLVAPPRADEAMTIVEAGPLDRQVVTFADGSRVVVGAQSTLRYPATWPESGPRAVWLDGEAFFEVQRRPDRERPEFYVHTPDGTVEVLGTTFTVRRRHDRTMVVLNEGAVAVRVEGTVGSTRPTATLRPGDLAEFQQRQTGIRLRRVNPEVYSSWTTDVLLFDETPVAEVVERIEATYDLDVVLPDSTVLERTLSGSIPNYQLDLLLRALGHTLGRTVYRQGDTVHIAPAPPGP